MNIEIPEVEFLTKVLKNQNKQETTTAHMYMQQVTAEFLARSQFTDVQMLMLNN